MNNKYCMFLSHCPNNSSYNCCYYCKNKCSNECKDNPLNCQYNCDVDKNLINKIQKPNIKIINNKEGNKLYTLHKLSKLLNKDINIIRKTIRKNNLNLIKNGGRYCLNFEEYIKLKSFFNI